MKRIFVYFSFTVLVLVCFSCNNDGAVTKNADSLSTQTQSSGYMVQSVKNVVESKYDENFETFAFVACNKYLVLMPDPNESWIKGKPSDYEVNDRNLYTCVRSTDSTAIPEQYTSVIGKLITVCDKDGNMASAKICGLKLLAVEIPHFATVQAWQGQQGEVSTDEQIAEDIWSSGKHFLVAQFVLLDSTIALGDVYFAVPSSNPKPVICVSKDGYSSDAIYNALSQTTEYQSTQAEYNEKMSDTTTNWLDGEGSFSSISFYNIEGASVYALVNQSSGNACGGEFYGEYFSLWKQNFREDPEQLFIIDKGFSVILAVDIDGDKILEYILDDSYGGLYLLSGKSGWGFQFSWSVPYLDCPC